MNIHFSIYKNEKGNALFKDDSENDIYKKMLSLILILKQINKSKMLLKHLPLCLIFTSNILVAQYTIKGMITGQTQIISGARVTLFNSDTTYFIEERSDDFGMFYFSNVSAGAYKIGVAKMCIRDRSWHFLVKK